MSTPESTPNAAIGRYTKLLLGISGMGGLLYGIDIGIISPALPYLEKTIDLTEQQLSYIVAAVLAGSAVSSVVAGALADMLGRKKMMIISALMFVLSVAIIYISSSFVPLLLGRLLQGASGGFIAVVVPLYLAECLPASSRGRGTSLFQLFLTIGIALAALAGAYYVNQAEAAIKAAGTDKEAVFAAADHAWRAMFLFVMWPGLVFLAGTFVLAESPRWLFVKGRLDAAKTALLKSRTEAEAALEMKEMGEHSDKANAKTDTGASAHGSILQRKYIIPFVLACVILGCNQATGINSILGFMGIIFQKAGLSGAFASNMDFGVKVLNVVATLIGVTLVDKMGRKFLLKTGTAIIIASLAIGAGVFYSFESKRVDKSEVVTAAIKDGAISLEVNEATLGAAIEGRPMELSVLYKQGNKEAVLSAFSNDKTPMLKVEAAKDDKGNLLPLEIKRAKYGPVPTEQTGYAVVGALMLFIIGFAMGPGVCVWLALSELMPTRIRSMGMGVALVINQGQDARGDRRALRRQKEARVSATPAPPNRSGAARPGAVLFSPASKQTRRVQSAPHCAEAVRPAHCLPMTADTPVRRFPARAAFMAALIATATLPLGGCIGSAMLFHPTHETAVRAPGGEALRPWYADGELQGYARETPNPRNIWLMCHGNAGQAAHRAYALLNPDDALYVLEYPGYGLRRGSPDSDDMTAAASRAYRAVQARHPGRPIGVLGESLGSGPASALAKEPSPPARIVLVVPYERLREVASEKVGGTLTFLFLHDDWDNITALSGYTGRLDIVAAAQDTVIPPHHAKTLAEAVPGAHFHLIPGGHNDWSSQISLRDRPQ